MRYGRGHKAVIRDNAKRFEYAREHGVCVRCGRKFQPNGRTLCPHCRHIFDKILAKLHEGR